MPQFLDVRIVHLEPMRVASVISDGATPEMNALATMLHWARQHQLLEGRHLPRFFGFDAPEAPNSPTTHAYEIWMTVPPTALSDDVAQIKEFAGGLYAVTRVTGVENIFPTWQRLEKWVAGSNFHASDRPCLEEHVRFIDLMTNDYEVDLYLPIEE